MGGTLYLNDGKEPGRSNIAVSGYDSRKDNFALSNFEGNNGSGYTFEDPDIGPVAFPTAEHYLHFQKLNETGKRAHLADWQAEKNPGAILAGIRDDGKKNRDGTPRVPQGTPSKYYIDPATQSAFHEADGTFKTADWDKHKVDVQMQINATKYQQSVGFQTSIGRAIALGTALGDGKGAVTIIEDTSSARREEKLWGTGPDGEGTNILGNSQTTFANKVGDGSFVVGNPPVLPKLADFQRTTDTAGYKNAEQQYTTEFQPTLRKARVGAGKTDTSDLDASKVQLIGPLQAGKIVAKDFPTTKQATTAQTHSIDAGPIEAKYSFDVEKAITNEGFKDEGVSNFKFSQPDLNGKFKPFTGTQTSEIQEILKETEKQCWKDFIESKDGFTVDEDGKVTKSDGTALDAAELKDLKAGYKDNFRDDATLKAASDTVQDNALNDNTYSERYNFKFDIKPPAPAVAVKDEPAVAATHSTAPPPPPP